MHDRPAAPPPLPAGRALPRVVQRFLDTEASGGIVLMVAALVALAWANSAWSASYESFWHNPVELRVGSFGVAEDVRQFVNDGLMALFFLVVGLEIKRELVVGDLRDRRVAALPVLAAIGGMVVPAAIFLALNAGDVGIDGWAIPIATDIAFALGVLTLVGDRVPSSLKLFLLSLAIVDDIGAIAVIAIVYAGKLDLAALALAAAAAAASIALRQARVHWAAVHIALGAVCWLAAYQSGVHATVAGVAFGLLTPARPTAGRAGVSPAERVMGALHPVTSFVILPLFALANAGVVIRAAAFDAPGATAVAAGVALGLVVGKLVGVLGATWLGVRTGVVALPAEVTWRGITGVAALAGVGFTVSLFVTGLAFTDESLADAAKLAVLAASVVASAIGVLVLTVHPLRRAGQ